MWELIKAALTGGGGVFAGYIVVMMLLRGCVGIIDASEPLEAQGVYEVWGIRGRPFIDTKVYDRPTPLYPFYPEQEIVIVIEDPPSTGNYVQCNEDQRLYQYIIKHLDARIDTPPGFWDSTILMYKDLLQECHL